jgi:cation transport regulator ChaC
MSLAVFAYGSLIDPESFARTLGREPADLVPARLRGWRRRWSIFRDNLAAEKTFAREDSGELPRWVLGLNLERIEDDAGGKLAPNGALIEIGETELERLDLRELRYDRVEVTGQVDGAAGFDRIVTYTAKPEHFTAEPPEGAVAMAPYLRAIEAAFNALGEGQWELFLKTTGRPPVETIEPLLVRDEIPPGNPRDW